MAILKILEYPNPRLRIVAEPVTDVNDEIRTLVDNMFETMIDADGIGLAATQVDVHQQVIVMDLSEKRNEPRVFINPQIEVLEPDTVPFDEGCLSVPGIYENVTRPDSFIGKYHDLDGLEHKLEADGLLSVCLQHEIDHLNGRVFVDHLSRLKQEKIVRKLQKEKRRSLAEA